MDFKASDNQDQTGLMDDGLSLKLGTQLKNIVFSVMFTLLKDHEMNIYIAIILCVIEFLQAISLIFYEIFETVWGSEDIFNVVSTGLSYTRLVTYVKDTNMTVYSAVFFILLAFLVLLLGASVYVSYIYSKKKTNFSWILNSFRYVVILITTILFLPVFEYFISFFHCVKDLDGQYVHAIFTEVQCWTGIHLADCVLAGVSAFILVLITIVATSTYFEARNIPSSPNSRVTSRACVLFNAYKLLIVILLTFLTADKYRILNIVVIMAGSVLVFYVLQFDNPFYNIVMAKVWSTSAAVNLWSATMLIFAKIMDSTSFAESIITWLLGIPMIVLLSIKIDDKRMDFLLINVNKFEKGKEIINQVAYLLKLLDTQHEDHNSAVLLDGYLEVHKQDCPDEDCPLKKKNKVITKNKIVRNLLSNDPNLNEKDAIIVYLVYQLYLRGLQKFDTDTTLRISYAFFLLDKMHSKHQALQELIEAEQKNPPPDEQFIIFRYKKIIEDDIADAQHEKQKDGLDLVNEIAFQSHFRMCQANIEKAALLHMEFWSQLSEDQPDLAKLADIGAKISLSIMSVEEHWGKLMKISPNNIKAMRLFGKFLIEVLHDIERGDELLDKAQSITNANAKKKNATNFITTGAGVDEGTPVIIISGEQERFALITTINLAASSLFGFSKTELLDRKINTLMPPIYAKYHDSFIDAYLVKNENIATATSKEKLAFGKNKANYIFPFYYTIKAIPSIIQGIQFVATIRLEKNLKNTAYVLVNPDGAIDSISSSCISLLKIDVKHIIAKKTKIQDCVPNVISDKANLFHSTSTGGKSHTQVQFTYPKDSEYIDEEDEKSASLNCQMSDLTATNLKDGFGYLFKFEKGAERTVTLSAPAAQEARITNFQFKFSKNKANIIGEFAEGNEDIENYYRRQTTNVHMSDFVNRANDNPDDEDYEEEDNKEQEIELQKKQNEEEEERSFQKIDYGIGIKTLRLMHGGIQEIEDDKSDDSSSKEENEQAASGKKSVQSTVEESQEEGSLSDFGNAEKSKKVLASVINDKTSPQNITNLKLIVAVAFLIMIGLSIFDYVNIAKKANDISTSVDNIDTSHQLIANIMIALSGVRDLYLLDNSAVTTTESVLKSKVQTALTTAKLLKETLESNQNDLSAAHLSLLNNAVIAIKNYDGSISYESLVQATEEVVTKGLNLITDDISLINPTNPDYIYLTTNLLNNYYISLETSAEYYTQGLIDKTAKGNISFILVLVFSILILALSMLALIPLIYSVVKARDHVLTLFFDIPSQTVKLLYSQCESFVSDLQLGEDDEVAAEVDEEEVAKMNEEAETNEWMPRKRRRKFRNTSKNYRSFFLTYLAMICFLEWVFIYNYTTSNKLLSNVSAVTTEYNSTSYAEFFFSFTNNAERQYFIDQSFQILNQQAPYNVINKSIILMQNLDSGILEENSLNIGSHTDTYNTIFKEIIYQDSCPLLTSVVPYATCEAFADMTITKGMTIANVRHFENLRTLLKASAEIIVNNTWPFDNSYLTPTLDSDAKVNMLLSLFRVPQALEAADMQDIYIKTNYRALVEDFKTSLKDDSNNLTTLRLLMFLLFIFEAIIVYVFIWLPLVVRLNSQLLKTKGMLRMIPIGVLVKIKNIRAYLRNFLNENHLHNY